NQAIPPGTQVQAEVILNKNISMTQQATVVLDGFLVRSARFIQSNPITVDIKIGEEALSTTAAVEQKTVLVCQTNEKKAVRFPKIATTPDCENAYCDAELMAEFLVSKAGDKLKEVQRQVANYKSDISNTNCLDQARLGYCSFENLNTRIETYRVFFQNDSLTPDFFKKIADTKGAGLGKFKVDYIVGKDAGGQIGQIGNKILLNGIMSGCGLYTVQIGGAVKVIGGRLDPDLTNILIDFFPIAEQDDESQLTEQCLPRVQNLMNFLPQDHSQKIDSGQTWFGLVQTRENSLKGIAKEVAKGMFNAEERFVDNAEGSNYIDLSFGAPQDYLVKIEMEQGTESGPRKISAQIQETGIKTDSTTAKTIEEKNSPIIELQQSPAGTPTPPPANPATQPATPPANPATPAQNPPTLPAPPSQVALPTGDQQPIQRTPGAPTQPAGNALKTQVEREAALAITGLKKNAIDGCISENDDYLLLKSAVQLTGFEIEMSACTDQLSGKEGVVSLIPGQQNCCTLKASSPLSEKVVPSFIATDIPGIEQTKFLQNDSDVAGKEVELKDLDAKTNKYASTMLFCTTANEKDFLNANGKKVTLAATSAKNDERHATDQQVSLEVCGIHPDKLIQKITEIKPAAGKGTDTYYATLVWQGEPEQINLSGITGAADAQARLEDAKAIDVGKALAGQTEIESQKRAVKLEGLGVYASACFGASALSSWKFGFGWFSDGLFNCLLPATWAAADLLGPTKSLKDFVTELAGDLPVVGGFFKATGAGVDFVGDTAAEVFATDPKDIDQTQISDIAADAFVFAGGYDLARILQYTTAKITPLTTEKIAESLAELMANQIMDEEFRKYALTSVPSALAPFDATKRETARQALKSSFKTQFKLAMEKYSGKNLSYYNLPSGAKEGKTIAQLALEEARTGVKKDDAVLNSLVEVKDYFVKQGTKDAFKQSKGNALKATKNFSELKSEAAHEAETLQLKTTAAGNLSPKGFEDAKKRLADRFIKENSSKFNEQLEQIYGKDFLATDIGGMPARELAKKEAEEGIRHYIINDLTPEQLKIEEVIIPGGIDPATGLVQASQVKKKFSLEFTPERAKKAMQAGINKANEAMETQIDGFVSKKAISEILDPIASKADAILTQKGGKYKLGWAKFKALLTSPLTTNFWKTMGKGVFTGAVSNAFGLYAYDKFMTSKHAAISGAGVRISAETTQGVDNTGNGRADTQIPLQTNDKPLVKYKTYPIVLTQKDGVLDWKIGDSIETGLIPKGAKRIQECNSSIYDKYQGLPNLAPSSEPFQEQKLLPASNISAVVNYYEKGYGRMLKDIDTQKNYGVPEALVVTVAMAYSGLGAEKDKADWIAGCKVGDNKWKAPAANFKCAAEELAKWQKDQACGSDPKCAMKKYFNNDSRLDYDVLLKSFNIWNSDAFRLAKNVQTD
ncbi:MAG: hypothetical protein AABW85_03105, partial [archaeon]